MPFILILFEDSLRDHLNGLSSASSLIETIGCSSKLITNSQLEILPLLELHVVSSKYLNLPALILAVSILLSPIITFSPSIIKSLLFKTPSSPSLNQLIFKLSVFDLNNSDISDL